MRKAIIPIINSTLILATTHAYAIPGSVSGNFDEDSAGGGPFSFKILLIAIAAFIFLNFGWVLLRKIPLDYFKDMDDVGAGVFWLIGIFVTLLVLGYIY